MTQEIIITGCTIFFAFCIGGFVLWYLQEPRPCGVDNHKFQPRYDIIPPTKFKGEGVPVSVIADLSKKIYVKDICVRCGKEVNL